MKDLHGAPRYAPAVGALSVVLLALAACSPTFNWRELRLEGTPLQALLPCKPETANRRVPMAGVDTELHMQSCETGGVTYALAWADLADATQIDAALAGWREASLRAIRADTAQKQSPVPKTEPQALKGATTSLYVQAQGQDHQGQALTTRAIYFAQGTQVYQAAVYGARLTDEAVTPFFEGLRLP